MNKEEQIKRLAQNLFKNGFTKSMDYAIQTAANMLGFPDSMVTNNLMKQEDSKYGTESLLNGGINLGNLSSANNSASSANNNDEQYNPEQYSGLDFTRRLSRSIAEERVFSQIPTSLRPPFSEPEKSINQINPSQSNISNRNNESIDSQNNETVFIDYSKENQGDDTMSMSDNVLNSSDVSFESGNDDASLEDSSFFSELREEEQTSLISGYMSSEKENFFSNAATEKEDFSANSADSDENIFKDSDYENNSELNMSESEQNYEIKSRFPVEFERDENFFASVSVQQNDVHQNNIQENFVEQERNNMEPKDTVMESFSQSVKQDTPPPTEASVDLTTMFDFRNMKG